MITFQSYPRGLTCFKGQGSEVLTKRLVFSTREPNIYDPLGLISPFTIKAKILLRKLWTVEPKLEWDDPLPGYLLIEWGKFLERISSLSDIKIKRVVKPKGSIGDPVSVSLTRIMRWTSGFLNPKRNCTRMLKVGNLND